MIFCTELQQQCVTDWDLIGSGVCSERDDCLVEGCGVESRSQGADLVGRCPFHDDAGPSLVVSPGVVDWRQARMGRSVLVGGAGRGLPWWHVVDRAPARRVGCRVRGRGRPPRADPGPDGCGRD